MNIFIREMQKSDIYDFYKAFLLQGWEKPKELFSKYFEEQSSGKRKVFVAQNNEEVCGYATLLPTDNHGPFANLNIPVVRDFNVLEKFQHQGIGTKILDEIENTVKKYYSEICLGVGLHPGYGAAQRLYIKRGYIPDGSGVWYCNQRLPQNSCCKNNDELVLYLIKDLNVAEKK